MSPLKVTMLLGLSFFFGLAFEGFYAKSRGSRPGGIRTFPLISLSGALLYVLEPHHAIAFCVGVVAIVLGILFKGMNVSFLVGLAFAVAASANLPAILMLIFWKRTSAMGVACSILVGMISALTIILLSPSMWERYGLNPVNAPIALDNPGIISIPLSFITLVVVSILIPSRNKATA